MKQGKQELRHKVIRRPYFAHALNSFLMATSPWEDGANIGSNGENLTIAFLSLNDVQLSKRLCASISECMPKFAGEIVAIDIGSTSQSVEQLRAILAGMSFRTRLIELGQDRGAAGNRNAMISHIKTQWAMCLGTDTYFIRNPLERIQNDISTLGCRFLNLPLLESDHKTLCDMENILQVSYDQEGYVTVGSDSVYERAVVESFDSNGYLSSYLAGKACLFDIATFKSIGGYDEALAGSFADLDLSIRLFRMGYKVGTTGAIALVHDPAPEPASDDGAIQLPRDQMIKEAALYFEEKYGYKLLNDEAQSQCTHEQALFGFTSDHSEAIPAAAHRKPHVALVVDIEHWAFYNIATQVKKHLGDRFDFDIIPAAEIGGDLRLMLMMEGYDLAHFFWRGAIHVLKSSYLKKQVQSYGFTSDEIYQRCILDRPVTTSVYDHLFLGEEDIKAHAHIFQDVLGYTVSSERLNRIYSNIVGYPPPSAVITDGVDLDRFHPKENKIFSADPAKPIVIGWAGNSAWSAKIEDFKGFQTLLRPALEELAAEGVPLRGYFADRQIRMIPHHEMPDYYSQIDIFVCSSKIEGTPNPVLEAMACGIPVISTDVGVVPEAFGPKQQEFILRERSKECLKGALRHLHENRSLLKQLSEENLVSIQAWAWSEKARLFGPFFEQMMAKFHSAK